ncbi:hypothetical protein ETB97_011061 [Aspergillus alliaceus]|uniref:Uncharacterized protein n=1 Tax=Petromyces alliaceus TaxID=209559 RepID=A0A8H5ZQ68_PETAA|nr:hypothetical protein ETB97_011061 [Aspergillus burnettii]
MKFIIVFFNLTLTTVVSGFYLPRQSDGDQLTPFPGAEWFKSYPSDSIITAMGMRLVDEGCDKYHTGPGPNWTDADHASYKCWQEKLGYTGAAADGWPGKKSWDELRVPSTEEENVNNSIAVSFWIKAFIPLNVAGVTKSYPKDRDMTMIGGIPIIGDCFLTDQRGFSNASDAKSRMSSHAWVWIKPKGYRWSQRHYCDETTEVDCEDGGVEGTETQNNESMRFRLLSGSNTSVVLGFQAARNNPLVTGSPDIDLMGTLIVDHDDKFVEFVGKVDEFPAFEAYVSINKGSPREVARLGPKPGADPKSLFGDANRSFRGRVDF